MLQFLNMMFQVATSESIELNICFIPFYPTEPHINGYFLTQKKKFIIIANDCSEDKHTMNMLNKTLS